MGQSDLLRMNLFVSIGKVYPLLSDVVLCLLPPHAGIASDFSSAPKKCLILCRLLLDHHFLAYHLRYPFREIVQQVYLQYNSRLCNRRSVGVQCLITDKLSDDSEVCRHNVPLIKIWIHSISVIHTILITLFLCELSPKIVTVNIIGKYYV